MSESAVQCVHRIVPRGAVGKGVESIIAIAKAPFEWVNCIFVAVFLHKGAPKLALTAEVFRVLYAFGFGFFWGCGALSRVGFMVV